MTQQTDFAIIGAGILGLSIAKFLQKKYPHQKIVVFEKEPHAAAHASGRNSGVLHAGIYYSPQTLKAKFCSEGRRLLQNFCQENKLALSPVGKVIVATTSEELLSLQTIYKNGTTNGATLSWISEQSIIRKNWPFLSLDTQAVIFSPNTSVVDPKEVSQTILHQFDSSKVNVLFNTPVTHIDSHKKIIFSGNQSFTYGQLINCAGCYADKIAHMCGFGFQYKVLPFKGIYKKLEGPSKKAITTNVYPVPDSALPFLGVHFTKSVSGDIYIGPNALPALGRENYFGLQGAQIKEAIPNFLRLGKKFIQNDQGIRNYAIKEMVSLSHKKFTDEAQKLVPQVDSSEIKPCTKVGIRAQLIDRTDNSLVMDFLYKKNKDEHHILNGISPGFTCAFPFAEYITEQI